MRMHNPPHPGRSLKEALEAIPMTVTAFAKHIGVSRVALSRIVNQQAGFTPEMSIRVSQAFGQGTHGDLWFRMQNDYDFWQISQKRRKKVHELMWEGKYFFDGKPINAEKKSAAA